ncbi:MAG: 23S rRNA (adenine(2503)-C(2))-methyltransferase RlmN [Clostridia bacterium]|nr:23S rRNA (adenine(2503)-C(2))-methyltransferase RlmN [Clostridia bacterium]
MIPELTSMDHDDVLALMTDLNEPKYRAKQVVEWINKGVRPENMGNIPKPLRDKLAEIPFGGAEIIDVRHSKKDDTMKFLYKLDDGNIVEGVLMRYSYGNTLCISCQVGCRMGCRFCASTLNGKVRDLTAGEMLSEVTAVERLIPSGDDKKRTVTNIVMMGCGEPLDNYENTVRFLKRAAAADGLGISPRNISLSTCGIVPRIYTLPDDAPHVTLCISLHAPNDELRRKTMPVANSYSLNELIPAAVFYSEKTGRRVIFEYALIEGVNSSDADAKELSRLLKGVNCHVNLIPLNSVKERKLNGVSRKRAQEFALLLQKLRISATVRRELGTDIDGACGQLRNKHIDSQGEGEE